MARMGHRPVDIPEDVDVNVSEGTVTATGPSGEMTQELSDGISIQINEDHVVLNRAEDTRELKSQHGLMRSLVQNIIQGAHEPFKKVLELNGLGYRVNKQGSTLRLELGYTNPIEVEIPDEIDVSIPNNTTVEVSGPDKQEVGEFAAILRHLREPDPYNQKGIKYEDEEIRQKVGKAVGGGEGPPGAEEGGPGAGE